MVEFFKIILYWNHPLGVILNWVPIQNPKLHWLLSYSTAEKLAITKVQEWTQNHPSSTYSVFGKDFCKLQLSQDGLFPSSKTHGYVCFYKHIFKESLSSRVRTTVSTTGSLLILENFLLLNIYMLSRKSNERECEDLEVLSV